MSPLMPRRELLQALEDLHVLERVYLNPRTVRDLRERLQAFDDDPACREVLDALEEQVARSRAAA